jgi:sulfur relay (sulfurtransferase) DsrC/TusE family protein
MSDWENKGQGDGWLIGTEKWSFYLEKTGKDMGKRTVEKWKKDGWNKFSPAVNLLQKNTKKCGEEKVRSKYFHRRICQSF